MAFCLSKELLDPGRVDGTVVRSALLQLLLRTQELRFCFKYPLLFPHVQKTYDVYAGSVAANVHRAVVEHSKCTTQLHET